MFNPKEYHYSGSSIKKYNCDDCEQERTCFFPVCVNDDILCKDCIKKTMNHESYYKTDPTLKEENKLLQLRVLELEEILERSFIVNLKRV